MNEKFRVYQNVAHIVFAIILALIDSRALFSQISITIWYFTFCLHEISAAPDPT